MLLRLLLVAICLHYAEPYSRCPPRRRMEPCFCVDEYDYKIKCYQVGLDRVRKALKSVRDDQTSNTTDLEVNLENIYGLVSLEDDLLAGVSFYSLEIKRSDLSSVDEFAFSGVADKLRWLSLTQNALVEVPREALQNLSELHTLILSYNGLEALGPQSFVGLHSLRRLILNNNKIRHIDRSAFEGMGDKLLDLDLRYNELTTIPVDSLRNMGSLEELDLNYNQISVLQPQAFVGTTLGRSLKSILLRTNKIRSIPYRAFASLEYLENLDFSWNVIERVHPLAFEGIQDCLEKLRIGDNRLHEVPSALKILNRLRFLDLQGSQICALRKDDFVPYGKTLRHLFLHRMGLTSVDPEALLDLKSLRYLTLSLNKLTTLPNETYAPLLHRLASFDVYENPLHCDCDIAWLREEMDGIQSELLVRSDTSSNYFQLVCAWPERHAGALLKNIRPEDLTCEDLGPKPVHSCQERSSETNSNLSFQEETAEQFGVTNTTESEMINVI